MNKAVVQQKKRFKHLKWEQARDQNSLIKMQGTCQAQEITQLLRKMDLERIVKHLLSKVNKQKS